MTDDRVRAPPEGFDAICRNCGSPYTFRNAKALHTEHWQEFCTNTCHELNVANDDPSQSFVSETPYNALRARCDALLAALRDKVISHNRNECYLCNMCWKPELGEPERHAPGCLAAPEDAP